MKWKIITTVLLSTICFGINGQSRLSGVISDSKTGQSLPSATAYINNSTLGSLSDVNGKYNLTVPPGDVEIVFSFIGYQTTKIKLTIHDGQNLRLDCKMVPLIQSLADVNITAKLDKDWFKYIHEFKKVFLGETKNSLNAKIINPQDINLSKVKLNGIKVLKATAEKTIEIENPALGYYIYYELKDFNSSYNGYLLNGHVFFKEMFAKDSAEQNMWNRNRLAAYRGSLRHLLKSILDNQVDVSGFKLFTLADSLKGNLVHSQYFEQDLHKFIEPYYPGGFYVKGLTPGTYRIQLKNRVIVFNENVRAAPSDYRDVFVPIGGLEVRGPLTINDDGILLNPSVLFTSGYLSKARVADMLPNNYNPGQLKAKYDVDTSGLRYDVSRVFEFNYVHTDKAYYYPGDIIWLKGYFKYNHIEFTNAASAVVYVDLLDANKQVLQSKSYPIDSGRFVGDILLPDTLQPGAYFLRSYTQWMRNYGAENLSIKNLPVLQWTENVKESFHSEQNDTLVGRCRVSFDKKEYHPGELIKGVIRMLDDADNGIATNLSVSVTDVNLITPIADESRISKVFLLNEDSIYLLYKWRGEKFKMETGISISGQFRPNAGKPTESVIKIIQGKFEEMIDVTTDAGGRFWVSGFFFLDTTSFFFKGSSLKRKEIDGIVVLDGMIPPKANVKLPELKFLTNRIEGAKNHRLERNGILLKEVTIKNKRILPPKKEAKAFTLADLSLSGDELLQSYSDIIVGMQARIPGLQVDFLKETMRLGPQTSFHDNSILLVVDGVVIKGDNQIDLLRALASSIKRMEVFKFGGAAIFGARGSGGVISITTKKGEKANARPVGFDSHLFQHETVTGYSSIRKFTVPNYTGSQNNIQDDFRDLLYWDPNIRLKAETGEASIKFYAADHASTYRVIIEGLTEKGEPVHKEAFIEVK